MIVVDASTVVAALLDGKTPPPGMEEFAPQRFTVDLIVCARPDRN